MDCLASPAAGAKTYPIEVADGAPDNAIQVAADGCITLAGALNVSGELRVGGTPVALSDHDHGAIGNDGKITTVAVGCTGTVELSYAAANNFHRKLILPDPGVAEATLLSDHCTIDGDVW